MLWYCRIDGTEVTIMPDDQPWDYTEGWVPMVSPRPDVRPDRFGDFFGRANGQWEWVKYPDPPFPVVYHEGKLKNSDTLNELLPENLPGQIQSRLSAVETALAGIAQAMALQVSAAQQSAQQAQQSANSAGQSKNAVDLAIAALPKPTQYEVVTATLGSGGTATVTFTKTYTSTPILIPIPRFVGDQVFIAAPGAPSLTGTVTTGKRTRGTLLLTSGPFEPAVTGDVVQFAVIGR